MRNDKSTSPFEYNGDWDTYEEGDFSLLEKDDQVIVRIHSYSKTGDRLLQATVTKVTKRQITVQIEGADTMRFSRSSGIKIGDNPDWHPTRIARTWSGRGAAHIMTWAEAEERINAAAAENERVHALRELMKRTDSVLRQFSVSIGQINEMNALLDRWEAEKK